MAVDLFAAAAVRDTQVTLHLLSVFPACNMVQTWRNCKLHDVVSDRVFACFLLCLLHEASLSAKEALYVVHAALCLHHVRVICNI